MALKRTTEEVAEYFRQQGCVLMDEYVGCMEPMEYRCSCGSYSSISWNNFTKGKRCGHCVKWGLKKKRSLAEVQTMFRERGCEFLDDDFKGIHHKHRYRCRCGREAEICLAAFHHLKQYCKACGVDKRRGPLNHGWKADREQHRLDVLFRKRCYKALQSSLKATGKAKVGHTSNMLGYGPKELQEHITSHPDWPLVKDGDWAVDHYFPLMAFLKHGIYDVALINSLDNLRPMDARANVGKSDNYDEAEFRAWLATKGVTLDSEGGSSEGELPDALTT